MFTHSQTTGWNHYDLEKPQGGQDTHGHFQHGLAATSELRFAIFKSNLIDSISRWLTGLLPHQVILFAAIQLWTVATTGPYAGEDHEITLPQAIARWQLRHQKR